MLAGANELLGYTSSTKDETIHENHWTPTHQPVTVNVIPNPEEDTLIPIGHLHFQQGHKYSVNPHNDQAWRTVIERLCQYI